MAEHVFLTGVTGFLGREILWRLLRRGEERVACLVRAESDLQADRRLAEILDGARPEPLSAEQRARASAVRGDLTLRDMGLGQPRLDELAGAVTRIVHGAASVRFDMPIEQARSINVDGTARVLDFAAQARERGRLEKLDYIGTAYVCGSRRGLVGEEQLEPPERFHNSYEQTKAEAERAVRERAGTLPTCIFRPSIIVGDSRTGYTSSFKVLYWPLKVFSRGLLFAIPARADGVVDVVPVDYVCDAIEAISARPENRGKAFHLTAGPKHSITFGECVDMAARYFDVRKPLFVDPQTFYSWVRPLVYAVAWGKRRKALRAGRVYVPYLSHGARFDTTQAETALGGCGLPIPDVQAYFERLLDYAVRSEWGKRAVQ
jgi:long-chain acyl-CoA synthetase